MTIELRKVYDGVADTDKTYELFQRHQSSPLTHDRMTGRLWLGEWWEITEEVFYHFLEVTPPLDCGPSGYLMLEAQSGNVHSAFMKVHGHYVHCYVERYMGNYPMEHLTMRTAAIMIRRQVAE